MRKIVALCALVGFSAFAADSLPGSKVQVKTGGKSDVQTQITDQAGVTLLNVQGNNSAPGAGGGAQVIGHNVETSAPSYTNGDIAMPWIDLGGRQYVTTDAATNLRQNLVQLQGAAPSATNTLPSQLTDGAAYYVGAKTGQLPSALGQTTKSGSVSITIASDQGAIATTPGVATGLTTARATPVTIASAGTTAIVCKGSLAISQPIKIVRIRVTGAAMGRCTAQYNDNATITKFGDLMLSPASPRDEITFPFGSAGLTTSATATTQQIEMNCTNFDAASQDFGCDVSYCQAASGC